MINSKINLDSVTKSDRKLLCDVFDLLRAAEKYIREKNDKKLRLVFECHSICRAVAKNLPELKVIDGKYFGVKFSEHEEGGKIESAYATHSWLETPDKAIIDPYPVGYLIFTPILVVNQGPHAPFGGNFYLKDDATTAKVSDRDMWRKSMVLGKLMRTPL